MSAIFSEIGMLATLLIAYAAPAIPWVLGFAALSAFVAYRVCCAAGDWDDEHGYGDEPEQSTEQRARDSGL